MEDHVTEPEITDKHLLAADAAIDVWSNLEDALAGKNGFGGDVAEIYAYRLVFEGARGFAEADNAAKIELAGIAASHLTHIARRFVHLRKASIAIEELVDGKWVFKPLDLHRESMPPFDWRLHLRVTPAEEPTATASSEEAAWERLRAGFETLLQQLADNAHALQQLTPELQQALKPMKPKPKSKKKTGRSKARRRTS